MRKNFEYEELVFSRAATEVRFPPSKNSSSTQCSRETYNRGVETPLYRKISIAELHLDTFVVLVRQLDVDTFAHPQGTPIDLMYVQHPRKLLTV